MKRKIFCIAVAFILVFSLAACGGGGGQTTFLTMGTGGVAGTWYPVGGVIAGQMSNVDGITVTAQATAASIENIRTVGNGEREIGFATSGLLQFARDGIEMFEGEAYPNIGALFNMLFMQCQFLVRADSGIYTLQDLAGHNVGTGAPGSGDEVFARGFLQVLGLFDQVRPMALSFAEQVTAFKDRQLDAIFVMASAPTAAMLDAAAQADVRMIPFTRADKDLILTIFPFFVDTYVTNEHYTFITEPIESLGAFTTLFVCLDVPDDVVYAILEAKFDGIETIRASHNAMRDHSMEAAVQGLPIDLHPGAERFFRDRGVL